MVEPIGFCPFCHGRIYRGGVDVENRRTGRIRKAHKRCAERGIDYTTLHRYKWPSKRVGGKG